MNRSLRPYVESVASGGAPPASLADRARALLRRERDAAARRKVKSCPRRAAEQVAKGSRRDRMAGILAEVRARSGGTCEVCRLARAEEMHHVVSGPSRRSQERAETCIDLCRACHRGAHRNDEGTLELVAAWAEAHGFIAAAAAVERRLAKVNEARGAAQAARSTR